MDIREDLDLSIDENNLVEEWQKQPSLMLEYSILLADAEQTFDEAKAALTVGTAQIASDIRTNPADFGLSKITEAAVNSTVPQQKQHQILVKETDDARHAVRIYKAAVEALSHRKSALNGMTELFTRQWFSDQTKSKEAHGLPSNNESDTVDMTKPTREIKRRVRKARPRKK